MKLIFLTYLTLLISCSFSSELNDNKQLQLSDLNYDVLYIVVSRLKLIDILNLMQVNSSVSELLGEVLHRKFNKYTLKISPKDMPTKFNENENVIVIYNVETALNVLKYFGMYFHKIEIDEYTKHIKPTHLKKISQYLNKYCRKTLNRLKIELKYDFLDEFALPFHAVEELTIRSNIKRFSETRPLNELFPNLRRFHHLNSYGGIVESDLIDCTFSNLEHFSVEGYGSESVKKMIRKNPTIRSLSPILSDPSFLKFINLHLPNLENLTIFSDGYEKVQLNSVKNVQFPFIFKLFVRTIDNITIPHLESLRIWAYPRYFNKWMEFFGRHSHLRNLHLANTMDNFLGSEISNIDEFTAVLVNLTDVTVGLKIPDKIDTILRFFQQHRMLNKCRFPNSHFSLETQRILRERLGNEWSINFGEMIFERRQPVLE